MFPRSTISAQGAVYSVVLISNYLTIRNQTAKLAKNQLSLRSNRSAMVGIVILNYNNSAQTLECLDSIRQHCDPSEYRICIVDNASTPEQQTILEKRAGEHIIISSQNRGYACGNNLGLRYLADQKDISCILVLNDDTRLTMDIIRPMEKYLMDHPECGVVCPLVLAPDGSIDRACARRQKGTRELIMQASSLWRRLGIQMHDFLPTEGLRSQREVHTQVPPGSCMMLRSEVWRKIGFLDEGTFLYFEEHILCEKLRREGLGCVLLPSLEITHLGAQTTKKQPSSAIYKHWRRSYLYFLKNYTNIPAAVVCLLRFRTWLKTLL